MKWRKLLGCNQVELTLGIKADVDMYVSVHFLSPKIKGGTLLKQKATISDWGFKVLPLHHNLTVSAVAGEGEQTRRESRARCGSQWTNRPRPTNRTHAIPIALAESSGIDRQTLSLSLRDIAFEISQAGEKTRRDYTRDLLASHASCGPPNLQILCYFAS